MPTVAQIVRRLIKGKKNKNKKGRRRGEAAALTQPIVQHAVQGFRVCHPRHAYPSRTYVHT